LHEVSVLSEFDPRSGASLRRGLRAFRAQGNGLQRDGIRDGDCILVDAAKEARPGAIVVAHIDGEPTMARVDRHDDGTLELKLPRVDTLPLARRAHDAEIVGVFAGIIRKRGFASAPARKPGFASAPTLQPSFASAPTRDAEATTRASAPAATIPLTPPGKLTILHGKLGMLEMTCAATKNPRLRRALRNEANHVRRLLQNETQDGRRSSANS
jgi:hypothetical protein